MPTNVQWQETLELIDEHQAFVTLLRLAARWCKPTRNGQQYRFLTKIKVKPLALNGSSLGVAAYFI
jgi:hypothetical protein